MNPNAIVVAAGCYVQTEKDKVDESIDIVVGNNKKKDIIEILNEYEAEQCFKKEIIDINHTKEYEELQKMKS